MNRGILIFEAIVTGFMFGVWLNNFYAGMFMCFLIISLGIIKTVK
jgi:hypothetical protein